MTTTMAMAMAMDVAVAVAVAVSVSCVVLFVPRPVRPQLWLWQWLKLWQLLLCSAWMPLRGQICDRQTRTHTHTPTRTTGESTFYARVWVCVCVVCVSISVLYRNCVQCQLIVHSSSSPATPPTIASYQLPSGIGHLLTDSGHAAKDNISDLQALALCKSLRKSLQGSSSTLSSMVTLHQRHS